MDLFVIRILYFVTLYKIMWCFQVRIKYSEQYEYEQISNLLGMDKKDGFSVQTTKEVASFLPSLLVWFCLLVSQSFIQLVTVIYLFYFFYFFFIKEVRQL